MATTKAAPGKKGLINFDFLQKLGKVLMTVIAVMPAAGLMISLGKLVQMGGGDIAAVMTIGTTMENIGWAVINNLHILFAVAIGGSWAKERAGGAFAAVLAFALINVITGNIFGVTSAMLADPNAVTHTLFGQEIAVNGYFTSVLGAPALNMGVFVGIIAGFVGGVAYNKYYNFRKLPDALAFFNGKRFVPMVVIGYQLSQADFRRALHGASFWVSAALRLLILPLLALGVCMLMRLDSGVTLAVVIAASTPPAALLGMFAAKFDKDVSLAPSLVAVQTLLSMITMPLVLGLAKFLV